MKTYKIIQSYDNVQLIWKLFPHMTKYDVCWIDHMWCAETMDGYYSLYGYQSDNLMNTYSSETIPKDFDITMYLREEFLKQLSI